MSDKEKFSKLIKKADFKGSYDPLNAKIKLFSNQKEKVHRFEIVDSILTDYSDIIYWIHSIMKIHQRIKVYNLQIKIINFKNVTNEEELILNLIKEYLVIFVRQSIFVNLIEKVYIKNQTYFIEVTGEKISNILSDNIDKITIFLNFFINSNYQLKIVTHKFNKVSSNFSFIEEKIIEDNQSLRKPDGELDLNTSAKGYLISNMKANRFNPYKQKLIFFNKETSKPLSCVVDFKNKKTLNSFLSKIKKRELYEFRVEKSETSYKWKKNFEIKLIPDSLKIIEEKSKETFNRIEFGIRTKMSELDSVIDNESLSIFSEKNKLSRLGICDLSSVHSFPNLEKTLGNKVMYGLEFDFLDDSVNYCFHKLPIETNLNEAEVIFFDLETTGIIPAFSEIIEFAAIKTIGGNVVDKKSFFIKSTNPLADFTKKFTGITENDMKNAMSQTDGIREIKDFLGNSIICAHNASFDASFLIHEFKKHSLGNLENPIIDTLSLSRIINKRYRSHSLSAIAKKSKIPYELNKAHRADYDTIVLLKIWKEFLFQIKTEYKTLNVGNLNDNFKNDIAISKVYFNKLIAFAKNQEGLQDIFKIVSKVSTTNLLKYGRKVLLLSDLREIKLKNNIIVFTELLNDSILFDLYTSGNLDKLKDMLKYIDVVSLFGIDAFVQLLENKTTSITKEQIKKVILDLVKIIEGENKILIGSSSPRYIFGYDEEAWKVAISAERIKGRRHPLWHSSNELKSIPKFKFKSDQEMIKDLSFFFDVEKAKKIAIDNTIELSNTIEKVKVLKDKLYPPKLINHNEKIEKFISDADKKFLKLYGNKPNNLLLEKYNYEKNKLEEHGFLVIYYLCAKLVNNAKGDGQIVGSRGSVGSSFLAFLSNITEVNPLPAHYICKKCFNIEFALNSKESGFDLEQRKCKFCDIKMFSDGHDIPFESFVGIDGNKVPDIDLNFDSSYRETASDNLSIFINKESIFRAGTISTVADKTSYAISNKHYDNFMGFEDKLIQKNWVDYFIYFIEGIKKSTGQHPGGLIICPEEKDINEFTPINYPADTFDGVTYPTTHFDFHSIHDNLLKLDILGHDDPKVLRELCLETKVKLEDIPFNDKQVLNQFSNLDVYEGNKMNIKIHKEVFKSENTAFGLPEFGTEKTRKILDVIKPKSFSDLVRVSGISHGEGVWEGNNKTLFESGKKGQDLITCRDDIFLTLSNNYLVDKLVAFKITDLVRKGIGLSPKYIEILRLHKVPDWYIESCTKIKYLFPKAHATAYVIMAWRIAWFKIYYKLEYYSIYFTNRIKNSVSSKEIFTLKGALNLYKTYKKNKKMTQKEKEQFSFIQAIIEANIRGININGVTFDSLATKWKVCQNNKNTLIAPFNIIPGVDKKAEIIEKYCKENINLDYESFIKKFPGNKNVVTYLKDNNFFDRLKNNIAKKEIKNNKKRLF